MLIVKWRTDSTVCVGGQVLEQVETFGIQLYPLPDCDDDEDEDYKEQCRQLKVVSVSFVTG